MRTALLVLTVFLLSPSARAVCPSFWDFENFGDAGATEYLFGGGPVDGLAAVAQSLIAIGAGTDKNNVMAKYTVVTSGAEDLPELGNTRWFPGCNHALSFSFSSPIDKSDNVTDLATLDGLANAFTFTVSYTRYVDRIRRTPPGNVEGELDIESRNFWGVTATIGRESFDYVNFDDFEKEDLNERPWSVSLFLGSEVGSWTVTGRLKVEESYKDQDGATRCRPIENSTDLDCLSGPSGPPNKEDGRQASIELRRLVAGRFGVAPAIHHDFKKDVTGIDLPVFLWQDAKGQLTGGFRVGWRDDTNNTEFGLFISQPF